MAAGPYGPKAQFAATVCKIVVSVGRMLTEQNSDRSGLELLITETLGRLTDLTQEYVLVEVW
jgi:hypothetical protein